MDELFEKLRRQSMVSKIFSCFLIAVALFFGFVIGVASCENRASKKAAVENTPPPTVASTEAETTTTTTTETTVQETIAPDFELVAGEMGEYGQERVVNAGTDFEETVFCYYVPSGTYIVTNMGEYPTQVDVLKDELVVTEAGWEEWADAEAYVVQVGDSCEINVPEGYFIELDEPAHIGLSVVQ
ncbi:MAG: hypothetical protein K6F49_04135 [Saccharofermentans sp.]|nr:hypothetical protein [Saccharofermentans sp.]